MASSNELCFLCLRPLGQRVEWHHPVPKSRGGKKTAPVHPVCHRFIHATFTNKELERSFSNPEALRAHPEVARYVAWIGDKDPDFHVPTRRGK